METILYELSDIYPTFIDVVRKTIQKVNPKAIIILSETASDEYDFP